MVRSWFLSSRLWFRSRYTGDAPRPRRRDYRQARIARNAWRQKEEDRKQSDARPGPARARPWLRRSATSMAQGRRKSPQLLMRSGVPHISRAFGQMNRPIHLLIAPEPATTHPLACYSTLPERQSCLAMTSLWLLPWQRAGARFTVGHSIKINGKQFTAAL